MKITVDNFISQLRLDDNFRFLDVPEADGEDDQWYYYAYVNGYFKSRYFALYLEHHKVNDKPNFRIVKHITEKPEELQDYLKTISTINFKIK